MRSRKPQFNFNAEEDSVKSVARAIRQHFIQLKGAKLQSPNFKLGERSDKMEFWTAAAKACIAAKAGPADWVKAAFEFCELPQGPFSNVLGGPAANHWYQLYKQTYNYQQVVPAATGGGEDEEIKVPEPFDVSTAISELPSDQWRLVASALGRQPSTADPEVLAYFQDPYNVLDPWFRLFIYPNDPIVWERFSYPGVFTIRRNPDLLNYLQSVNAESVRVILSRPKAPKHDWLKFDDSYDH